MKNYLKIFCLSLVFISACGDNRDSTEWLVPQEEIFDGGPGKDGIPSIDTPNFSSVQDINFLEDTDLVIGYFNEGQIRAYPHDILDWHEIVNDDIANKSVALTYCPLTGTAIGWDRNVGNNKTTFGVSGKLYNSNLIPYDRNTDSYWSQIGLNCINGELFSTEIKTVPLIETTWETWKTAYPNSMVLNTDTGFSRTYGVYPYGDYITNHSRLAFPVEPLDDRIPAKERVLGLLSDAGNKSYRLSSFGNGKLVVDSIGDETYLIIGSQTLNFIVAYAIESDAEDWSYDPTNLPVIAKDGSGNALTIHGDIVDGPLSETSLSPTVSFMAYWFSLGAFYPGIDIYE